MAEIRITEYPSPDQRGNYTLTAFVPDLPKATRKAVNYKLAWTIHVHPGDPEKRHERGEREFTKTLTWESGQQPHFRLDADSGCVIEVGDIVEIEVKVRETIHGSDIAVPAVAVIAGYTRALSPDQAYLIEYLKNNFDHELSKIPTALDTALGALGTGIGEQVASIPKALHDQLGFQPKHADAEKRSLAAAIEPWVKSQRERTASDDRYVKLWTCINETSTSMSFANYSKYVETVLCRGMDFSSGAKAFRPGDFAAFLGALGNQYADLTFPNMGSGGHSFEVLRYATEAFLLRNAALPLGDLLPDGSENSDAVFKELGKVGKNDFCDAAEIASNRRQPFCVELLWSYWHEESALVQAWKAICLRFQNRRAPTLRDPLINLDVHPLRPLSNLIWSYVRSERDLLTPQRRNLEYEYAMGISLVGNAVKAEEAVVRRSGFLAAFHGVLNAASQYYREEQDTNVIPDPYPLLNALRELRRHLVDSMHNQYGQLPWQAKAYMLMLKWLMARPEVKDFLPTRPLTISSEPWMDRVDVMKRLQGWHDIPSRHFATLADIGERLLLSIRFGPWGQGTQPPDDEGNAKSWAATFKGNVKEYVQTYRTVCGVDLSAFGNVDQTMPSVLLQRQVALARPSPA